MDLSFRLIGVNEGRFYWQCTEHEVCKNSFEYIISENRFDFVNADPIEKNAHTDHPRSV